MTFPKLPREEHKFASALCCILNSRELVMVEYGAFLNCLANWWFGVGRKTPDDNEELADILESAISASHNKGINFVAALTVLLKAAYSAQNDRPLAPREAKGAMSIGDLVRTRGREGTLAGSSASQAWSNSDALSRQQGQG